MEVMDIKEKIQEIINHRKGLGTYVGKGHLDEVKKVTRSKLGFD